MATKRKHEGNFALFQTVVILAFLAVALGGIEAARTFVVARLPLFVALGLAVLALVVLVLHRLVAATRARAARQRVLDAQIASTDGMSGPDFERLVARLLERDGCRDVRNHGGSGDLGADVLATTPDGTTVVVQCKRFSQQRRVSSPDMQRFLGTCFDEHGADHAWFVTTTRFSGPARGLFAVVELDGPPRFLPADAPENRPGLEERCQDAHDHAKQMPHRGADWGPRLAAAGFTVEGRRALVVDVKAAEHDAVDRYAVTGLQGPRNNAADALGAKDLLALDELLDAAGPRSLLRRSDLAARPTRAPCGSGAAPEGQNLPRWASYGRTSRRRCAPRRPGLPPRSAGARGSR